LHRVALILFIRVLGMNTPTLYLFQSPASTIYAVSTDKTGCSISRLNGSTVWLLRGEIARRTLPDDVIVAVNTTGYCLLEEVELSHFNERH